MVIFSIIYLTVWFGLHWALMHFIFKFKQNFGELWPTLGLFLVVPLLGSMLYMDVILCKIIYSIYTFEQVYGSNATIP